MTRDELGQYLAETLDLYLHQDDVRSRPWYRETVGDLLTHVDAYVQADRERVAKAIEAEATKADESAAQPREPIFRAGDEIAAVIFRAAARIARAAS